MPDGTVNVTTSRVKHAAVVPPGVMSHDSTELFATIFTPASTAASRVNTMRAATHILRGIALLSPHLPTQEQKVQLVFRLLLARSLLGRSALARPLARLAAIGMVGLLAWFLEGREVESEGSRL